MALVPVLALVALLAWAFASPIGAGPDDDFHLVSSWCAGPTAGENCAPTADAGSREVPVELVDIAACFAGKPGISAACQRELFDGDLDETVATGRGNFTNAYPPVYYAVTGLFTSDDVQFSGVVMRIVTILLFLGLTVSLFLLLPHHRRSTLVWGWLITTIPMGIFLLGTNNPSAWAVMGVGSSWLALLGYFESTGRRRISLGAVFVLSVVLAAGSRGDAAIFAGFGILLVLIYTFRRTKPYLLSTILPVVMGLVALVFFLGAGQGGSGLGGFGGGSGGDAGADGADGDPSPDDLQGIGRLAYNLLNAPFIWVGSLGEWGLGWLDTSMPAVVPLAAVAAFVAIGFLGLRRMTWRKAVVLGLLVLALWLLPVYVLQQGGGIVGQQVQPRYLLPLIAMLGGMLVLAEPGASPLATRTQRWIVAGALSIAHLVALQMNLRRYVTGVESAGFNLDAEAQWWWDGVPFSPMFVWVVGSVAYAALVFLLVEVVIPRAEAAREGPEAPRRTDGTDQAIPMTR